MEQNLITQLTAEAAGLIRKHYVFPDIGEQVARVLETADYGQATGPEDLGSRVTADLQSINGDKHLRLKFHAEELPDLPSEELMWNQLQREAARDLDGIARLERLDGGIALLELGPLLFPPPLTGAAVCAAMNLVAGARALILDLRNTLGGSPTAVALICSYLFGDEPVHINDCYDRSTDRISQFWTQPFVPGPKFGGDKPLWVLTSGRTFSGGEELAYDLQQLGRAVIAGERTGGGAHPRIGIRVHPHLELTVPTGRSINPVSGTNWEGTGVVPDVEVAAADAEELAKTRLREELSQGAEAGTP
ncbi:peptidase S41-like protein [Stackebrandtia albiflava]|uniref:Peptidase S41-like protein n=1 Tax=Stackebrandtia albiflava TaxID=406432 RepID=A0A562UQ29_9ACTN|nr:S41 family peptidase [Stackebrandtia albiflava]TWJ07704.1 peptidase S41-like protein [Stackebrandtia albiflava]